eukprot:336798_1
MTTGPIEKGAPERSGRFVKLGHTECGIHSTRKKIKRMREEAEAAGRDFDGMMSLPCPGCTYEITPATFDDIVFDGKNDKMLLLEFYSPLCGGCQEFTPKLKEIINALTAVKDRIEIGRYDITDHDVPPSGQQKGLNLEATPDLYLIKQRDPLTIVHYDGEHEVQPIIQWISEQMNI